MNNQKSVQEHYGANELLSQVNEDLSAVGLGTGELKWSDVAAIDQFHVRGLQATQELATAMKLGKGDTVLDVGSGLGGPARYLAAEFGCHVTGIDLCEPFVEVAIDLAKRTGFSDLTDYRQGNALDLPFESESFDHVITQHVAMNIEDRLGLYTGIHHVLKPGGTFAIYDVIAVDGKSVLYPVPWARDSSISFLLSEDELRLVLTQSGFAEVSFEDKSTQGIEWFAEQKAAPRTALSLKSVMGPEFPEMAGNVMRNLVEGRVRLAQTIYRRV